MPNLDKEHTLTEEEILEINRRHREVNIAGSDICYNLDELWDGQKSLEIPPERKRFVTINSITARGAALAQEAGGNPPLGYTFPKEIMDFTSWKEKDISLRTLIEHLYACGYELILDVKEK